MKRPTSRSPKRKRRNALAIASVSNLVFILLLYIIESLFAEKHWLATIIAYFPQHLFVIPSVLFLIWSVIRRNRMFVIINTASLLFALFALLGLCVPWRSLLQISNKTDVHLRVMTYNIHHSDYGGTKIADLVRSVDPDIICLQESDSLLKWSDAVNDICGGRTKWYRCGYGEVATLSKYPILSNKICQMETITGRVALKTIISVRGRLVTVVNVHLDSLAKSKADPELSTSQRLTKSSDVRQVQINSINGIVSNIPGPLIMAGDFNTPPRGPTYRQFKQQLSDSFAVAGWGLGSTFRASTPLLRIDYVFLGNGVIADKCWVVSEKASDHLPVIADVHLK